MVSIITVNYRTKAYLERMLASLFAHVQIPVFDSEDQAQTRRVEVIVVENGSGDDLHDLVEAYPQVTFVMSNKNLGFAGGCNLGIQHATGDYLLLVNPDVEFTEDAVTAIEERMDRDQDVGVGGISLKNSDGSQQACVWRFPTPADQLLLLLKIPHIMKKLSTMRKYLAVDFDYSRTQDCDQVMGAFFCIRREVYEHLNGLDDGFFMWYEEVDFCKRAVDANWKVRYYHDVSAMHARGSSFLTLGTWKKQAMVRKSLRRYAKKHWGIMWWIVFTLLTPVFMMAGLGATALQKQK